MPVLIGFFIDWLTVSGRIEHHQPSTRQFFQTLDNISRNTGLPSLRVLILIISFYLAGWPDTILESFMLLAATLVLAGICGRIAALALLLMLGAYYKSGELEILAQVLVFAITGIMLLGTGARSLWLADERWINRHDGA